VRAAVQGGSSGDALWMRSTPTGTYGQRLTDSDVRHALNPTLVNWPDGGTP
jgi:hypothetical protein